MSAADVSPRRGPARAAIELFALLDVLYISTMYVGHGGSCNFSATKPHRDEHRQCLEK